MNDFRDAMHSSVIGEILHDVFDRHGGQRQHSGVSEKAAECDVTDAGQASSGVIAVKQFADVCPSYAEQIGQ